MSLTLPLDMEARQGVALTTGLQKYIGRSTLTNPTRTFARDSNSSYKYCSGNKNTTSPTSTDLTKPSLNASNTPPGPISLFLLQVDRCLYPPLPTLSTRRPKRTATLNLCRKSANHSEILHRRTKRSKERPRDKGTTRRGKQVIQRDDNEVQFFQSGSTMQRKTGIDSDHTSELPTTAATSQIEYHALKMDA